MKSQIPKLICHGGAGLSEGGGFTFDEYDEALRDITHQAYSVLERYGAREAVLFSIRLLESNPMFNAGTGSRLQKDGQIRMSAAIMSSDDTQFSAVINISHVEHPIDVAHLLNKERYTVLGGAQATDYARIHNMPYYNPVTGHRLNEYKEAVAGETGTVGAVALDAEGIVCAGTSTGGVGYELPGRIGDSATVAGTYASSQAGVSCTGRGENIVNMAVAARVVTQVEDGQLLGDVVDRLISQANTRRYRFGLITIDHKGQIAVGQTDSLDVLYASHDGQNIESFITGINRAI